MVEAKTLTVAVTGAAGQIAYSLLPQICNGLAFGESTFINLKLLDIPVEKCQKTLEGVSFELEDSAFKLLKSITFGSDPKIIFKDCDLVVFSGGMPR